MLFTFSIHHLYGSAEKNIRHSNKEELAGTWRENLHLSSNVTPWSYSASEQYLPSDRCMSAKLVPTFADRGCHVVSATDPHDRILGFLDLS
jgi:hypothetical protein